jgi:hypothetical protein
MMTCRPFVSVVRDTPSPVEISLVAAWLVKEHISTNATMSHAFFE